MTAPRRARLFFALWPGSAERQALAAAASSVALEDGRRVPTPNLHLTLAFIGAVDAAGQAACLRAAARVAGEPFALDVDRVGHFPRARVAWLGLREEPAALIALVATLRARLAEEEVACDPRPFRSHVTIARDVTRLALPQRVPAVHWSVTEFTLVESVTRAAGPRYEIRAGWLLRTGFRG